MYRIVFFNANFTSRLLFGMVKPFLSQRVHNKVRFLSGSVTRNELLENEFLED